MASSLTGAAFAETYSTPGNEAAVGINGSNANAQYLAVSDYGTATAANGVAVNYLGNANGMAALSWAGTTNGMAGLSGLGSGNGSFVGASGTGTASSSLAALSATGTANGWTAAVSGTGNSYSSTYNSVAVSGTGDTSTGPGGVGFSLAGNGNGGLAGATVFGSAGGGTAVNPSRTKDSAEGAVFDPLRDNDVFWNMGISAVLTPYQSWLVGTAPPDDPAVVAAKHQQEAANLQRTIETFTPREVGPPPSTARNAAEAGMASGDPYEDDYSIADIAPHRTLQQRGTTCGPAAAWVTYGHRGMPSYEWLMEESGNTEHESGGSDNMVMQRVIKERYVGPSLPILGSIPDPINLVNKVKTAVTNWDQGITIGVETQYLNWWNKDDGTPRPGWHALGVYKYIFLKGRPEHSVLFGWDTGWNDEFRAIPYRLWYAATAHMPKDGPHVIW